MANAAAKKAEVILRVKERLDSCDKLFKKMGDKKSWFNNIPQDYPLPVIRFRFSQGTEWDTKDSVGWEGVLTFDAWTDARNDGFALEISDIIEELFHDKELGLEQGGQNLLLRHTFFDAFTEPDGITHHSVTQFAVTITN